MLTLNMRRVDYRGGIAIVLTFTVMLLFARSALVLSSLLGWCGASSTLALGFIALFSTSNPNVSGQKDCCSFIHIESVFNY